MNNVLISTTSSGGIDTASKEILNRSFLYDKDKNVLYIKFNSKLNAIGGINDKAITTNNTFSSSKISATFATVSKLNEVIQEINKLESDINTIGSIKNTVYNDAVDSLYETIITPTTVILDSDIDLSKDTDKILEILHTANVDVTEDQIVSCELSNYINNTYTYNITYNKVLKVSLRDKLNSIESSINLLKDYVYKIPILEPETEHIVY